MEARRSLQSISRLRDAWLWSGHSLRPVVAFALRPTDVNDFRATPHGSSAALT